jgi:hypothetical protein
MPRGAPKKTFALRLDPELVTEVRLLTDNLTAAIEEGLRLWVKRTARKSKQDGLTSP